MNITGWKIKDFALFFMMVAVAVLVVKFVGAKIPGVKAITDKM